MTGRPKRVFSDAEKQRIRREYEAGHGLMHLQKLFGCGYTTIVPELRRLGIVIRGVGMQTDLQRAKYSGKKHHGWKGGRMLCHGYWHIRLPDHPHNKDGYVSEHRLAMENHLRIHHPNHEAMNESGFLKREFVVHHRNGNKQDNRIENLEVMERSKHHSWMHYKDEAKQMRLEIERLKSLLDEHGISYHDTSKTHPNAVLTPVSFTQKSPLAVS